MPTIYFPQLAADGFIVERGSTFGDAYETAKTDSSVAQRTAWAWRGAGLDRLPTDPLGKWTFAYTSLTDAERDVLVEFFRARRGRYESFALMDPYGNLVPRSEDFTHSSWEKNGTTPGASVTDPFGGNLATSVASSGSNANLVATVIPDGDAAGFVICGSVWVKAPAAQTLSVGFVDSGFSVLDNRIWDLPADTWRRIWCTTTLATNSYIRLLIGGFSTWSGQTLQLFGAQCVPLPGPAAYVRTPGRAGLRRKVRFDQDAIEIRTLGPNQHATNAQLLEVY
ncbi:MAG: hypothetical protein EPO02_13025 [Nitrospirae bacterium]|nr:MAG: hypothetical protein EPO02_13025 [Nitrospirota bacterium]